MWIVFGLVGLLVLVVGALVVVVVGRESEERRRGGLLELDTWEARNALRLGEDVRIEIDGTEIARSIRTTRERRELMAPAVSTSLSLKRCIPSRNVHYHGDGDWCECGRYPNLRGDAA